MDTGAFLVFEGTEGSGKTTQLGLFATRCAESSIPLVVTREPGGTQIGEQIRDIVLADHDPPLSPRAEALLHTAARAQHISERIQPTLARGINVLSDRFSDSTIAYQGGGQELPIADLQRLQQFAVDVTKPDLRIFFDIPVEVGLQRRFEDHQTSNRIDRAGVEFHGRVADTFRKLIAEDPEGWLVVDAQLSVESLAHEIAREIRDRIPQFAGLRLL